MCKHDDDRRRGDSRTRHTSVQLVLHIHSVDQEQDEVRPHCIVAGSYVHDEPDFELIQRLEHVSSRQCREMTTVFTYPNHTIGM